MTECPKLVENSDDLIMNDYHDNLKQGRSSLHDLICEDIIKIQMALIPLRKHANISIIEPHSVNVAINLQVSSQCGNRKHNKRREDEKKREH